MKIYLLKIWLLIFLVSCIASLCLCYIVLSARTINANSGSCDMSILLYVFSIFQIIIMTISNTTIFMNLNKKIRENYYYSLASFLLAPFVTTLITQPLMFKGWKNMLFYGIMCLPFLIVSALFFWRFRKLRFITKEN